MDHTARTAASELRARLGCPRSCLEWFLCRRHWGRKLVWAVLTGWGELEPPHLSYARDAHKRATAMDVSARVSCVAWVVRGVLVMMVCGVAGNMHVCNCVCAGESIHVIQGGEGMINQLYYTSI